MKFGLKIFAGAIVSSIMIWVADAFLDYLFYSEKTFGELLFADVTEQKIFLRLLVLLFFFVFGIIILLHVKNQERAKEKIKDAELRYSIVAEKTNDWEFWKNPDGTYNYIAPAFERITGYLVEDLMNDSSLIKKIIHPADQSKTLEHFNAENNNTMEVSELEFRIITQNKTVKTIKHICQPVYGSDGKFIGTRGSNIDVSERTIENSKTLLSNGILMAELQDTDRGVYAVDSTGKIVLMNKNFRDLWNINGELLNVEMEDNLIEIMGSKLENPASLLKTATGIRKNSLKNYSDQLLLKDGKKIETRSLPIQDSNGKYLGRVWNFKETNNSNGQEKETDNQFDTLFENVPDAFFSYDLKGIFTNGNKAAERLTGYKKEELIGKSFLKLKLLSSADILRATKILIKIGQGKTTEPERFELSRKDGKQIPVEITSFRLSSNGKVVVLGIAKDLSKMVGNENSLKENEARLKKITESVHDALIMANENGEVSFWNSAAEKIFGYKREEVFGKELTRLIFAEEFGRKYWNRSREFDKMGQDPLIEELTNLPGHRKNGEKFLMGLSLSLVEINGKNHTLGVIRDITDQVNYEKRLIQKKHDLQERLKEINCMFEISRLISEVNITEKCVFEKSIKLMQNAWQYPEITCVRISLDDNRIFETDNWKKSPWQLSAEIVSAATKYGTIKIRYLKNKAGANEDPFLDEERNLIKGVGLLIGEFIKEKRTEKALIESEQRFRKLYENSSLGIYRSTSEGEVIMANPAALSLLGYNSLEELKSKNIKEGFYNPDDRKLFQEILEREGTIYGFETQWKKQDGTLIHIRESARVIKDERGETEYYEGIFEDFTEKKNAERDLLKAKGLAEEINRLKTNFLDNMSHELRTPITGITGFAEMLKDELKDEDHRQMASIILESGKRLSNAINLILDLTLLETHKQKLNTAKVNIIEALEDSIHSCEQRALKKGLKIFFKKEKDHIYCKLDRLLFIKAVENILDNAFKFTDNGSITVNAGVNGQATIQIADTGIGIPENLIGLVFEPFRQGSEGYSRNYEGTGLGLTIAKKYIEALGGSISVESKIDYGTTFTISFSNVINSSQKTTISN